MGRPGASLAAAGAMCVVAWLGPAYAQPVERCEQAIAEFVSVQGATELLDPRSQRWQAADPDMSICPGDVIRVGPLSRAAIAFLNSDAVLNIDQNTTVEMLPPPREELSWLELLKGAAHFFSRTPRALEVRTPFVNAAVEGTEFFVRVEPDHTYLSVFDGQVSAANALGDLTLANGQAAVARAGQAPVSEAVIRPRDAVQWTLYYPPLFAAPPPGLPANLAEASGLLAVGRVDEARAALEAMPDTPPAAGIKYALLAVIAVAQNDKEGALTAGRRAVDESPDTSAAKIALSYALQANFELESARDTLRAAVEDTPDDALDWARLAEVWLSLGYLDEAMGAAEEAR